MARAIPVCAIIASRLACDFVSTASVTTTTSVVFSEGVASGPPLSRALQHVRRERSRQSASAEFVVQFERRRPEPWPVADGHAADGIDDRERPDHDAAVGLRGSGAEAALEIGGGRAEAGADAAQREIGARRTRCGVAEIAIGREASPCLVAAVEQIEADRARNDRNDRLADSKAAALFGKPGLYAARGVQPERRAAGERDGVDRLDGAFGLEQRVLAGAGPAAAHVDRGDRGRIENDRGDAGGERRVVGVADANAGNIGEEIFQGAGPSGRIWLGLPPRIYQPRRMLQLASASRIILASSDLR